MSGCNWAQTGAESTRAKRVTPEPGGARASGAGSYGGAGLEPWLRSPQGGQGMQRLLRAGTLPLRKQSFCLNRVFVVSGDFLHYPEKRVKLALLRMQ